MHEPHLVRAAVGASSWTRLKLLGVAALAFLLAIAFGDGPARAANGTWTNTSSGGLWSGVGNWQSGAANGTDGIADFSTLNITADNTVHLDSARTVGQLKFGDTVAGSNWILDNNNSVLNILTLNVSVGTPTINVVNDTATISASLFGTQGFAKTGAGTLLLSGSDAFSGAVQVNAGTLSLGSASALGGAANTVTVGSGATLDLGGQTIGANPLTIVGTGVGGNGALVNTSANPASYSGTVTITNAVIVGGSGNITLSGSVNSGANALTKIGPGTLTLSGTTDNNGLAVTVNAGTVVLAKASSGAPNHVHAIGQTTFLINGGLGQLAGTGDDQIFDLGNVTVTSGAFDLNGHNETIAAFNLQGTGIANGGALVNSAASNSSITATSGITLAGNATIGVTQSTGEMSLGTSVVGGNFALTKTGPGTLDIVTANTFSGGLVVAQGALRTNVLTLNNAGTTGLFGNNTSVTLGSNGQTGTIVYRTNANSMTNMPFTLAAGGTGAFDTTRLLTLTSPVGGAGSLVVTGVGVLTLNGNNTFTGSVTISNGAGLNLNGSNAFTGGVTINDSAELGVVGDLNAAAPNPIVFGPASNGSLLLGNSVSIAGLDSIATNVNSPPTVQNEIGGNLTLTVNISGSSNSNFAGVIMDGSVGGTLSLTKTGSGTLTLLGNNTYTGTTTINGGTLRLAGDDVNFVGQIHSTTVIDNGVLEFAVPIIPSAQPGYAYSGNISGTGGLMSSGKGKLTLSGINTFTGPTTITAGTLVMAGGSLTSNVTNQATFNYTNGTFAGRLTNLRTATFDNDFTAGNGMENDGVATAASGVNLTFNGAGLDNEGTLNAVTGSVNVSGAANVNRGNLSIAGLGLAAATLTNNGSIVMAGGVVSGAGGTLINGIGGTISGSGFIMTGFNNAGGALALSGGTLRITQPFSNSGLIVLNGITAGLTGGAITNTETIQGFGNIGNNITNLAGGTVEAMGGTLALGGTLVNAAGGLLTSGSGSKLLITAGMPTNAGIINLTGGIFDNGGYSLSNVGQISGWGVFRFGGAGLDNNGTITFSGGITTVTGPVTNEGGKTITVAQNNAIFSGMVTNNQNATFNTVNATATFAGGFTNSGSSNFAKAGNGVVEIDVPPTLNSDSTLSVNTGTLRFNVVSGTPTIGAGVSAIVASGATLELAGSVAALVDTSHRVDVVNDSAAPGVLVTGKRQRVGGIDGAGSTQVNAGSDLTADHVVQSALVIGGTPGNPSTVTIAASGDEGNPLFDSSAWSIGPASNAVAAFDNLIGVTAPVAASLRFEPTNGASLAGAAFSTVNLSGASVVPEPSSAVLLAIGGLASVAAAARRSTSARRGLRPAWRGLRFRSGGRAHG